MDKLFAAATLAAHTSAKEEKFRQREIRFYIELFANWLESKVVSDSLQIHNTQISRYLRDLTDEGLAKATSYKGQPCYRLTRTGLLELISQLVQTPISPFDHFFFVYQFVTTYTPLLIKMIEKEGSYCPPGLRIEIRSLLDTKALLNNQRKFVEMELKFLDFRISDTLKSHRLSESLARDGKGIDEMVKGIEAKYPYDLNNRKPLSQLAKELPEAVMLFELTKGNFQRVSLMWEPKRQFLKHYLELLLKFEKEPGLLGPAN